MVGIRRAEASVRRPRWTVALAVMLLLSGLIVIMGDAPASAALAGKSAPAAPSLVVAQAGNARASVSWTPPANDGGSAVTGYTASCSSSNGGAKGSASGLGSPAVVPALTNGHTYTCTVTATNAVGTSRPSTPSNSFTLPGTVPGAPTIGTATAGAGSVSVVFRAPTNDGGNKITGYTVSCVSSNGGVSGSAKGAGSPIRVAGLTNGDTYTCAVTATNAIGTSVRSASSNSFVPVAAPDAPTIGVATAGDSSASVTFVAPVDDGGAPIASYAVTCASSDGGATGSMSGAASPVSVSGLTNGDTYTCAVTATNAIGTSVRSASSNSFVPAGAPDAPTIGVATAGDSSASVTFVAPADDGGAPITSYAVTCASSDGGATGSMSGAASPVSVSGLTNGETYSCTVTATNAAGTSLPSSASTSFVPGPATTIPIITPLPNGTTAAGSVTISASSSAPSVQFYLDAVAFGPPVAVVAGTASVEWSTWGLANSSSYVWTAADCNSFGCNPTTSTAVTVTVDNQAPTVTAPADGATTASNVSIQAAASGGGLAFFLDGVRVGFDSTAPYSLSMTGPLADGTHSTYVQECDTTGTLCNGPTSRTVTFTVKTLQPRIISVSPNPFSPIHGGRKNTTSFRVHLPDSEVLSFVIENGNGQTIQGPHTPGLLSAGDYTYRWNGENNKGEIAGDGTYTIVVTTSGARDGVTLHGSATATIRVDDTLPILGGITGNGTTFYPLVVGYEDTFQPKVNVSEAGSLWLEIFTTSGTQVNVIAQPHASIGTFQLTWNGRNLANVVVAEGWYWYHFVAANLAGTRSSSVDYRVYVSHKQLVNKTGTFSLNGNRGMILGSDSTCEQYSYALSAFSNGIWLDNFCDEAIDGFESISTQYSFTVPCAIRYNSITVRSYGNTIDPNEDLLSAIYEPSSRGYDGVGSVVLTRYDTDTWSTLGTVGGADHVSAGHVIAVTVGIGDANPPEDYDIGTVQITVSYAVLQ